MKEKNVFEELDGVKLNPLIKPYYEGDMPLETYGESKLREVINVGKITFPPLARDAFKELAEEFLCWGSNSTRRELIEERMRQRPCWGWNFF